MSLPSFHRFCIAAPISDAFRKTIFATVKPGDVVLDIGAGTGILSLFACQAGARKVYAVEMDYSIEWARQIARANGFQDRITFLRSSSFKIDLQEKADVLVTNTFEYFGINGGMLGLVLDARARLLKPEARIIPQTLELFVAPVELPELYEKEVEVWNRRAHDLDFSKMHSYAANTMLADISDTKVLLGEAASFAHISLAEFTDLSVGGEAELTITRSGTLHGLYGYFQSRFMHGISVSNAPGSTSTGYRRAFLPLSQPIEVRAGDRLKVEIQTYNGVNWRWSCKYMQDGKSEMSRQNQSTFLSVPHSKDEFRKLAPQYAPALSERGKATHWLLSQFNGKRTLAELEREMMDKFPGVFSTLAEAAIFVRNVALRE